MRFRFLLLLLALTLASVGTRAQALADPAAVVAAFHAALRAGDAAAAESLLAADLIVLEQGHSETRAEYLRDHLPADIAFAQSAREQRGTPLVTILGDAAWVSGSSQVEAERDGTPVRARNAELIVLSREAGGWSIRAIHWSSQRIEPAPPSAPSR
jgi:ketosteroid isomerase-like protein